MLQVSRPTLREALRLLESLGLVEIRQRAGTFLSADEVPLTIHTRPTASKTGLLAIYETRLLIEPQVVALAAQRATAADLEVLQNILHIQVDQIAAGGTGALGARGFHAGLCQVTRNPVLQRLCAGLQEVMWGSRHFRSQDADSWRQQSLREHEGILAAFETHDAPLARQRMTEHLESLQRLTQELTDT